MATGTIAAATTTTTTTDGVTTTEQIGEVTWNEVGDTEERKVTLDSQGILRLYFHGWPQGRFNLDRVRRILVCTSDAGELPITESVAQMIADLQATARCQ